MPKRNAHLSNFYRRIGQHLKCNQVHFLILSQICNAVIITKYVNIETSSTFHLLRKLQFYALVIKKCFNSQKNSSNRFTITDQTMQRYQKWPKTADFGAFTKFSSNCRFPLSGNSGLPVFFSSKTKRTMLMRKKRNSNVTNVKKAFIQTVV